jgi:hypothetical protein
VHSLAQAEIAGFELQLADHSAKGSRGDFPLQVLNGRLAVRADVQGTVAPFSVRGYPFKVSFLYLAARRALLRNSGPFTHPISYTFVRSTVRFEGRSECHDSGRGDCIRLHHSSSCRNLRSAACATQFLYQFRMRAARKVLILIGGGGGELGWGRLLIIGKLVILHTAVSAKNAVFASPIHVEFTLQSKALLPGFPLVATPLYRVV